VFLNLPVQARAPGNLCTGQYGVEPFCVEIVYSDGCAALLCCFFRGSRKRVAEATLKWVTEEKNDLHIPVV
jgi:hypothetical protein